MRKATIVLVTLACLLPGVLMGPADAGLSFVQVFSQQPHELYLPQSLATDELGNVYTVDHRHYLYKFDPEGNQVWRTGGPGEGDGFLYFPQGVAYGNGTVYVTDTGEDQIEMYSTGGSYIGTFGESGSGEGQFSSPYGIAVYPSACGGFVFVSDSIAHNVQRFTPGGTFVSRWGSFGDDTNQFRVPSGMTTDDSCRLYVTNQYGHQRADRAGVMIFTPAFGEHATSTFPVDGVNGTEAFPDGITISPDGATIWVAESGTMRISRFDRSVGESYTYASSFGSTAGSNLSSPHGVALNQQAHLFVANTGLSQIYEYVDKPPELLVRKASGRKRILNTQGLWFLASYNQVGKTCQITGRMTVDVPGHDPFKADGVTQVPDNSVDLKLDLSAKQTRWMDKAWGNGKKVSISGRFAGPCSDNVTISKRLADKI